MRMLQALEKRKIGKGDRFFSVLVPMLLIVFLLCWILPSKTTSRRRWLAKTNVTVDNVIINVSHFICFTQ